MTKLSRVSKCIISINILHIEDITTIDRSKIDELSAEIPAGEEWRRVKIGLKKFFLHAHNDEIKKQQQVKDDQEKKLLEAQAAMNKARKEAYAATKEDMGERKKEVEESAKRQMAEANRLINQALENTNVPSDWDTMDLFEVEGNSMNILESRLNKGFEILKEPFKSPEDVVNSVSGGHARKGVFRGHLTKEPPLQILAPMECVEWLGVSSPSVYRSKESFQAHVSETFQKSFQSSGYSNAVNASFSGFGISAETSYASAHEESSEDSKQSKQPCR